MTKITQIDPNTVVYIQSRAEMSPVLIEEYAAMMAGGVQFDPAEGLQDDSGQIFVWDGAHRTEAARQADQLLAVRLEPGSRSQAEWLALSANQKHGLRRSRADKQRVVRRALRHPSGAQLSNREIARHCGVDHKTVGRLRGELETSGDILRITERTVTRNGTTYQIDTKKLTQTAPVSPDAGQEQTNDGGRPEQLPSRPASETANGSNNGRQQSPAGPMDVPDTTKAKRARAATCGHHFLLEEEAQPHPCPRCGQQRVRGVNGSQRWCIGCGADWPTAETFLADVAAADDATRLTGRREALAVRLQSLLPRLTLAQLEQLERTVANLELQPVTTG